MMDPLSSPAPSASEPAVQRWIARVGAWMLGAAVVLMAVQVVLRLLFNAPQAWAEEVDRYLFVWTVYLGAVVAQMKGMHIRVTFAVEPFGVRGEVVSQWIGRLVGLACFAFAAYYGYELAWVNRTSEFYTIPGMPQMLFYLAAPVGLTAMAIHIVLDTARQFAAPRQP